jgi:preprotein translocase subunit SecD
MRPSRYLVALATIFIVLYIVVFATGSGSFRNRLSPKLAIDLAGGTSMVLQARTLDGSTPDAGRMDRARDIIEQRVNARGVSEAQVYIQGGDKIVVDVPGQSDDSLREVGATAEMRFRKVLATVQDVATAPTPTATPSPSGSAGASAAATASPSASATATPAPAPATTPAAAAAPSVAPTATGNAARPTLEQVQAKLGAAYTTAANIDAASVASAATATPNPSLDAFKELTPAEVAVLPYNIQFVVPQITCEMLNLRPAGSVQDPATRAVACEKSGGYKYLLDVAKVVGTDLSDAQANLDTSNGGIGQWKVDLTFNGNGANKWSAVTSESFSNTGDAWGSGAGAAGIPANPNCVATQPSNDGSKQVCMVAVVLDNQIITAPAIQAVLSTNSQITGQFDKNSSQLLASQLKYGALPISFDTAALNTVTATLGSDYLHAGLLAMGIGLALVVIYAFFYYRLLGSVIVLSLVLSGLLTFGMLVALGRGIGFTLSLAGIAGFIVSLGVAADSFVIYFERLKDEIREGRNPRAAVNRGWVRARRTIITANAVTIMAAVVLYLVGSSAVQGFAFALGLATMLDLVIVFLFRHPMMTMLARSPAFLSPRVSGLGRVLHHSTKEA